MLIRFVVENVLSFGERKEFNCLPNNRLKTLDHHKYSIGDFKILKTSSIYGANGAGKSNLVKSLHLLKSLVTKVDIPYHLRNSYFKFSRDNQEQFLIVEFIQNGTAFLYGLKLKNPWIAEEELYISGLGKKEDQLVFKRETNEVGETTIQFLEEFEQDEKSRLLKSILIEEFVKPDEPVLKLLANRDNKFLSATKVAFQWFAESLQIVLPNAKPAALAHQIDTDSEFKEYAEDIMRSFNIGIDSLNTECLEIYDFFGEDNPKAADQYRKKVDESPKKMISVRLGGMQHNIVKVDEEYMVKTLKVRHRGKEDQLVQFNELEESDGTMRLLDFVPAFKNAISEQRVYVVDEIERSIHPLLIKELIRKFSLDPATKGQLIFTTHESNLLDQDLFRQDEIWFAEKDNSGSTDLYSLSDFKEHKTIDIRKGYLNGRYGAIPFLGNLTDLNWHKYDSDQPTV